MLKKLACLLLCGSVVLFCGCTTAQKGGLAGGVAGAALGGAWAGGAGGISAAQGLAIGAGTGTATGALVGDALEKKMSQKGQPEEAPAISEAEYQNLLNQKQALEKALAAARSEHENLQKKYAGELTQRDEELAQLRDRLGSQVKVDRGPKGITLTFVSEVLFDSGKATLKPEGEETLRKAAAIIQEKYPDHELNIEGHTDNVPLQYSGYRSNWELSAARALSVLHFLVDELGFAPEKLSATGYGETRPVADNADPEGRAQNRRAVIVIMPKDVEVARKRLDM